MGACASNEPTQNQEPVQRRAPRKKDIDSLRKILLIGDSGVGKSSILMRYTDGSFSETFISTVGVDFKIKTIEIDGKDVKLQIWDTAGQERFRTITASYYRGANGIMIVFDVTKLETFNNVPKWMQEIEHNTNTSIQKILVGNKADLVNERLVSADDAREYANQIKIPYIETSAKTSENIDEVFLNLSKIIESSSQ